jgi:hypothetical protein
VPAESVQKFVIVERDAVVTISFDAAIESDGAILLARKRRSDMSDIGEIRLQPPSRHIF